MRGCALTIFAVWVIAIVTGAGPQSNVITPPAATAATTAAEVQLAGVPEPTTRSGCEVSTPRESTGAAGPPDAGRRRCLRSAGTGGLRRRHRPAGRMAATWSRRGSSAAGGVGAPLVSTGAAARSATGPGRRPAGRERRGAGQADRQQTTRRNRTAGS